MAKFHQSRAFRTALAKSRHPREMRIAVYLVRTGFLSAGDIGKLLRQSRQNIAHWGDQHSQIDWRKRRQDVLNALVRRADRETSD